ncbi:MAG TPA: carboxypeptidase-like regulatory domain-containing protein [Actinomycetota bacterium]|jgi:hypothetical protein
MKRRVLALGVGVLLAACGRSAASRDDSGVQGLVRVGPTCPVEQAESPCPDRPLATELRIVGGSDAVATVRSGDDGRFRVALDPGSYTISSAKPGLPSLRPVEVTVRPHAFTSVMLSFDSGIR